MLYSKSPMTFKALIQTSLIFLGTNVCTASMAKADEDIYTAVLKPPASIKLITDLPIGIPKNSAEIIKFLSQAKAVDGLVGKLIVLHDAPLVFAEGTTPVTFSSIDSCGKTITAKATVTVEFAQ